MVSQPALLPFIRHGLGDELVERDVLEDRVLQIVDGDLEAKRGADLLPRGGGEALEGVVPLPHVDGIDEAAQGLLAGAAREELARLRRSRAAARNGEGAKDRRESPP